MVTLPLLAPGAAAATTCAATEPAATTTAILPESEAQQVVPAAIICTPYPQHHRPNLSYFTPRVVVLGAL